MVTSTQRRASAIRKVGWLAVASMLAMAVLAPAASPALAGNAGAIWTTAATCQNPAPQDQNQYAIGDHVHIRASGLDANTSYHYTITGNPGGSSNDPGIVVAQGDVTTDADGGFCVDAYTIAADDGGEYTVDVPPAKNDNYRVLAAGETVAPTPVITEAPTPVITAAPTPVITAAPTPVQSVEAETATPAVTLPPTSTLGAPAGPNDGWRMILVAMAALLATVLVITPATAARRR